jgi:hypothetical protein
MATIPVFFCEETDKLERRLRRYSADAKAKCGVNSWGCDASAPLDTVIQPVGTYVRVGGDERIAHDDPRWPTKCDACGQPFGDRDHFQVFRERILRRTDTGEEFSGRRLPVGAVIDCWWHHDDKYLCGYDGRSLQVETPDGPWLIDSRASNCTMPDDKQHRCWLRHGRPEDGTLHVDKCPEPGQSTCAAGAGSIVMRTYHGFLHNGALRDC